MEPHIRKKLIEVALPLDAINDKAMIEIPPKFAGRPPVNLDARPGASEGKEPLIGREEWKGAQGLAEDVRYYGRWMRDEAEKRIGRLYPKVEVTAEMTRERPDLDYRLYVAAERRSRAAEALSYNALVQSWPEIARLARTRPAEQTELL